MPDIRFVCCLVALAGSTASAQSVFTDVSASRGIVAQTNEEGMAVGLAAADYDGDGWVDFFVPQAQGTAHQLYRNLGNGSFSEVASTVGLDVLESGRAALFLDFDGDGDLDLVVYNDHDTPASAFRLYEQDATGQFIDATSARGLFTGVHIFHTAGLAAGDINNDGYLDLYSGAWGGPPHLFLNNNGTGYTDISNAAGIRVVSGLQWQPILYDFNRDGFIDIYAPVDSDPNILWLNQGDNTFLNVAPAAGLDNHMNDMGMTLGDFDNDGDFDVYVTNIDWPVGHFGVGYNVLLRNDTVDGVLDFTEVSGSMDVDHGGWGWGATFLDFDNDRNLDIAATNGFNDWIDPSVFFRNPGNGQPFENVSDAVQFNDMDWGSSLVSFDIEHDGDLDLIQVCNEGPTRILVNTPDPAGIGNWLLVRPRMPGPNTHAIGAIVHISVGGDNLMRFISAGTSLLAQEPAEAFFGLGDAPSVAVVRVEWPDGSTTFLGNVPANGVLNIMHGTDGDAGCPTDLNGDGVVDVDDLYEIHQNPTDLDGDGVADDADRRCLELFLRQGELEDMGGR